MHHVQAVTLRSVLKSLRLQRVKLLKLDAEGAEPEVLSGAEEVLDRIEYLSVDAGFERGMRQESTFPEVTNYLIRRDFEVVAANAGRLAILFRNRAYAL